MSDATLDQKAESLSTHDMNNPIMERTTDLFGLIQVFPPMLPPSEWGEGSFLLMTDKYGENPGLYVELKPHRLWECWERPHFIQESDKWGTPDRKEVPKEEPKAWNIEIPDRKVEHKDFRFDD